jgi:cytosine/adenosine deaminase-related metal-dependent hydrolase
MRGQIDLLVSGGTAVTQNPARGIIAGGAVAIEGSRIVAVGPAMELDTRFEARRRIDASGRYVFPGLINTHTHLFQTFMKGLGEGLPLYQWIDEITAPSTIAMTSRDGILITIHVNENHEDGRAILADYGRRTIPFLDEIGLDPLQAKATPVFDIIASLVYSAGAGSVNTVVVAGQVLLDEGRITAVDERAVMAECQDAAWQLARRVSTCG